jgi:amino acid transporter
VAGALLFVHEPARLPLPCPPLYWVESGWSLLAPAALLLATTVCLCLWVASIALAGSRLLQVVSADRLLPRWLAGGVTRRGVPRRALVAFLAVAALPTLAFWLSDSWLLALAAYAMVLISSVATAAAGAVYPYLRREDYRTAAPSEILGLPTIALAGGLFVLFGGYAVWSWLFDSPPVAGYQPLVGRIVLVGMYLCTLSVFTVYRWMRRVRPGRQIELSCEPIAPGDGKR